MKRDTDMIVRQFPRDMDEVEVYPIGDVHLYAMRKMLLPSSHAAQTIRFKRLYRTVSVTME